MNNKEAYRKSRKSKRIAKKKARQPSVNKAIGPTASKYCKKMMHRQNRRVENPTYSKGMYSIKQRLWEIT